MLLPIVDVTFLDSSLCNSAKKNRKMLPWSFRMLPASGFGGVLSFSITLNHSSRLLFHGCFSFYIREYNCEHSKDFILSPLKFCTLRQYPIIDIGLNCVSDICDIETKDRESPISQFQIPRKVLLKPFKTDMLLKGGII